MSDREPHPSAPQDALTVSRPPLHCNGGHDRADAESRTRHSHDGWRHPMSVAAVGAAAASLITALTPLLIKLL